jgi:hypothetical protein
MKKIRKSRWLGKSQKWAKLKNWTQKASASVNLRYSNFVLRQEKWNFESVVQCFLRSLVWCISFIVLCFNMNDVEIY